MQDESQAHKRQEFIPVHAKRARKRRQSSICADVPQTITAVYRVLLREKEANTISELAITDRESTGKHDQRACHYRQREYIVVAVRAEKLQIGTHRRMRSGPRRPLNSSLKIRIWISTRHTIRETYVMTLRLSSRTWQMRVRSQAGSCSAETGSHRSFAFWSGAQS